MLLKIIVLQHVLACSFLIWPSFFPPCRPKPHRSRVSCEGIRDQQNRNGHIGKIWVPRRSGGWVDGAFFPTLAGASFSPFPGPRTKSETWGLDEVWGSKKVNFSTTVIETSLYTKTVFCRIGRSHMIITMNMITIIMMLFGKKMLPS